MGIGKSVAEIGTFEDGVRVGGFDEVVAASRWSRNERHADRDSVLAIFVVAVNFLAIHRLKALRLLNPLGSGPAGCFKLRILISSKIFFCKTGFALKMAFPNALQHAQAL